MITTNTHNRIQSEIIKLQTQLQLLDYSPEVKTLTIGDIQTNILDDISVRNLIESQISIRQNFLNDNSSSKRIYSRGINQKLISGEFVYLHGIDSPQQVNVILDNDDNFVNDCVISNVKIFRLTNESDNIYTIDDIIGFYTDYNDYVKVIPTLN